MLAFVNNNKKPNSKDNHCVVTVYTKPLLRVVPSTLVHDKYALLAMQYSHKNSETKQFLVKFSSTVLVPSGL